MAEESLIKTGEKMSVNVRVETNGASGVGTPLTAEEINKAVGVILVLRKLLAGIPRALEGIRSILLLPLIGVFATGFLMLAVNIPMAAINTGLNNFLSGLSGSSAVLLGLLVGGMMAVDMGGPVNKAAYVFGTGTLAVSVTSGGSIVMAAVMAAGMGSSIGSLCSNTLV